MKVHLLFTLLTAFVLLVFDIAHAESEALDFDVATEFDADPMSSPQVGEPYYFKVKFERSTFDAIVPGFRKDDGTLLLPIVHLSRQFEIGLRFNDDNTISGELAPDARFVLSQASQTVVLGARSEKYAPELVVFTGRDALVSATLISEWMPYTVEPDLFSSTLKVAPKRKLPIQERLERERLRDALQSRKWRPTSTAPAYANPYRLLSTPFLDQTLTGYSSRSNFGSTAGLFSSSYLTADVLYLETNAYLAGSSTNALEDFRVSAGRKDPYKRLLGPLGATAFAFGDINSPVVSSVATSAPLRGASVTNFPLNSSADPETYTFRGDLPPGWEAELYRGGVLIDFRKASERGQYEFERVPIFVGNNDFSIVLYGPLGQKEEYSLPVRLGDFFPDAGDLAYNVFGGEDLEHAGRFGTLFDVGITDQLAFSSGYLTYEHQGLQRHYLRNGFRAYRGPVYGYLRVLNDVAWGGHAEEGGMQYGWKIFDFSARAVLLNNFDSESYPSRENELTDVETASASVLVPTRVFSIPLGSTLSLSRQGFENGNANELGNQLSTRLGETGVVNQLAYRLGSGVATRSVYGNFYVSRRLGLLAFPLGANLDVSYQVRPNELLNFVSLYFDTELDELYTRLGYTRYFPTSRNALAASVGWKFEDLGVSLNLNYSVPSDVSAFLRLFFSLGADPKTNRIIADANPIAKQGSAVVQVFLDKNNNGVFDQTDTPLPGVTVQIDGRGGAFQTERDGRVVVTGLQNYQPVTIQIATHSLAQENWVAPGAYQFVPRPGRSFEIHFPVLATGEIDGTVFFDDGRGPRELGEVDLELVDAQGHVRYTSRSVYDGFYLFSKIRPGKYRLRVAPQPLERLNLVADGDRAVEIGEVTEIYGANFVVRRDVKPSPP